MSTDNFEKLDPEFKTRWVAALRSGDYRQGRQRLQTGDKHCCLGVGASLADQLVSGGGTARAGNGAVNGVGGQIFSSVYWYGPDGVLDRPNLDGRMAYSVLCQMNDEGKTFEEIADWIEENL